MFLKEFILFHVDPVIGFEDDEIAPTTDCVQLDAVIVMTYVYADD
jgi:hypothetical protein